MAELIAAIVIGNVICGLLTRAWEKFQDWLERHETLDQFFDDIDNPPPAF